MAKPKTALKNVAQTIAEGRTREASLSSSDMCDPASGARKHQRGVVIPTKHERP